MSDRLQPRRGRGRRPRLSDAETESRMLEAGRRFVAEEGLSLSLEHLSMEELIADAGVSRTSSYRRWPTKDAFAADLLLHIARETRLTSDFAGYADAVLAIRREAFADFATEQGRRDAFVAAFRALAAADIEASLGSGTWRSYLMLRAAAGGLPSGELRTQVTAALRESERGFTEYRAAAFEAAAAVMGYRLRDPDAIGWSRLAELLSATFAGLTIQAIADPEPMLATRECAPFGSSQSAPWSLATLASANVFFGATEPDPSVTWDDARIAEIVAGLGDLDAMLASFWDAGAARSPGAASPTVVSG